MSEFDDLDKPGFLTEAVWVTAGPKSHGDRRFAVICDDCNRPVAEDLLEEETEAALGVHVATCPNRGRTLRYVT